MVYSWDFLTLEKEICILCKYLFKRICSFHMIWMILTNKITPAVIPSTPYLPPSMPWKITPYMPPPPSLFLEEILFLFCVGCF